MNHIDHIAGRALAVSEAWQRYNPRPDDEAALVEWTQQLKAVRDAVVLVEVALTEGSHVVAG